LIGTLVLAISAQMSVVLFLICDALYTWYSSAR
jgi:hypothetical protein